MSEDLEKNFINFPFNKEPIVELKFKECAGVILKFSLNSAALKRWYKLKLYFSCISNEDLLGKFLDIVEEHILESPQSPKTNKADNSTLENNNSPTELNKKTKSYKKDNNNKTGSLIEAANNNHNNSKKPTQVNLNSEELNNSDIKSEIVCRYCDNNHDFNDCSVNNPKYIVADPIDLNTWNENCGLKKDLNGATYSRISLPNCFELSNNSKFEGIISKIPIKALTRFGPLVGKRIKEVDIRDDSDMKHIWELQLELGNVYINTEDSECSNWLSLIRPAPTRDERNLTVIFNENNLYLVSIKDIQSGDELFYWQDTFIANNNRKKIEKNVCGGCNMSFESPLYYKVHCSLFHDMRYSLTIRKYHCKICGAAILGKENIRKHAAELHNGKGAYQCQFCNKFFLRLSYLEMHRTYGCSSNPQRTKPLCDFCGRKFCQPQKLRVHIKRMHSDLTDLKEFQCSKCMKILGSRAALHRHLKEVHEKQMDGSYPCSQCGKSFQNKSNLKIHMLTHSGIKPFKCTVDNCAAAFTTKQCLQLHYRKIHNYDEESMPKIERSVSYTFQAYSGEEKNRNHVKDENLDNKLLNIDETSGNSDLFDDVDLESPILEERPASVDNNPLSPSNNSLTSLDGMQKDSTVKLISKGSKKWITDDILNDSVKNFESFNTTDESRDHHHQHHHHQQNISKNLNDSSHLNNKFSSISEFTRRETSNASLLVEAALDSVCNETSIDIDVEVSHNCNDSLVNNIYNNLSENNVLPPEVTYNHLQVSSHQDVHLLSPSVKDHISVTDDLEDEIKRNHHGMQINYGNLEDDQIGATRNDRISPSSVGKDLNNVNNRFARSHEENDNYGVQNQQRRFDFVETINPDQLSSDESNGLPMDNNNPNNIEDDRNIEPGGGEVGNMERKATFKMQDYFRRMRFDEKDANHENDNNQTSEIDVSDLTSHIGEKSDNNNKYIQETATDMRNRFDMDFDIRARHYENNLDSDLSRQRASAYGLCNSDLGIRNKNSDLLNITSDNRDLDIDFRSERHFEPLQLNSDLQGLDMSTRSFHNYSSNINRYHHVYPELDRMDLRLNYSTPPPPYDLVRVVSLDLTPPGRHSVDLSLRSIPLHQIANSRLLTEHNYSNKHRIFEQPRLLAGDLSSRINENRLISDPNGMLLSDTLNTSNFQSSDQQSALLVAEEQQRLLNDHSRSIIDQRPPLLGETHLLQSNGVVPSASSLSAFGSFSQTSYHTGSMDPRTGHVTSPVNTGYHHPYSTYYP